MMVSTAPGRSEYDQVAKIVNISGDRPAGLVLHAAAQLPSGEVQIFDLWDSEESISALAERRMIPAFTEAGLLDAVQSRPRPVHHVLFDFLT